MEKESQIAKENVKEYRTYNPWGREADLEICEIHLESCQRFLEFLEKFPKHIILSMLDGNKTERFLNKLKDDKIEDLKSAIKVYKEEGIK